MIYTFPMVECCLVSAPGTQNIYQDANQGRGSTSCSGYLAAPPQCAMRMCQTKARSQAL
jgi:hypothetical protein